MILKSDDFLDSDIMMIVSSVRVPVSPTPGSNITAVISLISVYTILWASVCVKCSVCDPTLADEWCFDLDTYLECELLG